MREFPFAVGQQGTPHQAGDVLLGLEEQKRQKRKRATMFYLSDNVHVDIKL